MSKMQMYEYNTLCLRDFYVRYTSMSTLLTLCTTVPHCLCCFVGYIFYANCFKNKRLHQESKQNKQDKQDQEENTHLIDAFLSGSDGLKMRRGDWDYYVCGEISLSGQDSKISESILND